MATRPASSSSSVPTLPPPSPKSPPQYPDLYGKRREMAKVQMLEREISFLEEELKSAEGLQPASRCCKEIADYVVANPDPLIPTYKKHRRRCQFWKWLCGFPCCKLSWICCCCYAGCSIHLEIPPCCNCHPCKCLSCGSCKLPKCQCCSCPTLPKCSCPTLPKCSCPAPPKCSCPAPPKCSCPTLPKCSCPTPSCPGCCCNFSSLLSCLNCSCCECNCKCNVGKCLKIHPCGCFGSRSCCCNCSGKGSCCCTGKRCCNPLYLCC